jgi:hypothetical protein
MLSLKKWMMASLSLALVVAIATARPDAEPAGGTSDKNWLISDAEFIVKFNIKQLMGSKLIKNFGLDKIKDAINNNDEVKTILDTAGLDVTKDLDSVLVSLSGNKPEEMKAAIVVRGSFDTAKVKAAMLKNDKVSSVKEGAIELFEISTNGPSMYASILDKNTIVVTNDKEGTVGAVKAAGSKAAKLSKSMEGAFGRFSSKDSMGMAVIMTAESKKQLAANKMVAKFTDKLESVTLTTTVTDEITMKIVGTTEDEKSAKTIAAGLELAKGLVGPALMDNEQFKWVVDLVEKTKITSGKDNATATLELKKETLEKLMKGGGE